MTILVCFLDIKRLVWKPLIIKVRVRGGHGTRGQRLRPQAEQCLAWGHHQPQGKQPANASHSPLSLPPLNPIPKAQLILVSHIQRQASSVQDSSSCISIFSLSLGLKHAHIYNFPREFYFILMYEERHGIGN